MTTDAAPRRPYRSTRRAEQAATTRRDVIAAAIESFGARGFAATTLQSVADRAGVAVETVYAAFKTKKRLVREAFEASVVGDAEPVALADRPEYAALAMGSRRERLAAGVRMTCDVHVRSAPLWSALVAAAAGDDEVAGWLRELEANRRTEVERATALIFETTIEPTTLDLIVALLGPELFLKLTRDIGWDVDTYGRELSRLMTLMIEDDARTGR
jgi:AcrR family transcriptional regulator